MTARAIILATVTMTVTMTAIGCESEPSRQPPGKLSDAKRVFDGFSIGDKFSSIASRAPYDKPCSIESVENGLYRVPLFCGDPKAAFMLDGDRIRAFGWVSSGPDAGGYFATKIALPVRLGDPVSRALAVFGEPHEKFDLAHVHVDWFDGWVNGNVCVMSAHRTVVGIVFGDMPAYADSERWRVFDALAANALTPTATAAPTPKSGR